MAGVRVLLDVVLDAEVGPCLQDQPVAGGRVADVGWSLKDWFSRWAKESSALMLTESDLKHLRRCVDLATAALEAGDEPFGSVLVAADGAVLAEDHNRVAAGDRTQHPEFALARWAAANLAPAERAAATVYTSGEHCPMCAAAHGWVGLGRIVYASSSTQLASWLAELGVHPPPVRTLPIREIVPDAAVDGPEPDLAAEIRALHERFYARG